MMFCTEIEKIIHTEPQKIPNNQRNLEQEQSSRHHTSCLQITLQSYSNQKSMMIHKKKDI